MLTLLSCGQGQNGSFDAGYQAVLNRAVALGYTLPSVSQQIKQNTLYVTLKTLGILAKEDILFVFANDAGQDFGTLNWINPLLHQATLINSPSFAINQGFTGNGTSSYIDTNFNAFTHGVNYQQDNASRYLYLFQAIGTSALDGKAVAGINNMARTSTSFQRINSTSGLSVSFDFTSIQGMKSINRTSSTNVELFNDTTQGSRIALSNVINDNNQLILRSGAAYGGHTISMYANGASLIAENTAFVNAFNTYITSL
jgi:hypothetical protein